MFKKIISVFLVICMLATTIPLTVGASAVDSRDVGDNEYYESEPNNGDVVNLLYSDMTMYGTLAGYDVDCYKIVLS